MAFENFVDDIFTGNLEDAKRRLGQWWSGLSPEIQSVVHTLATSEGQILQGLAITGAQDVISGGLTTASFTKAAADIETQLVSQNITLGKQTVFTALNAVVAANTSTTPTTVVPATTPAT